MKKCTCLSNFQLAILLEAYIFCYLVGHSQRTLEKHYEQSTLLYQTISRNFPLTQSILARSCVEVATEVLNGPHRNSCIAKKSEAKYRL